VAHAIARSGLYHRRSALLAGVAALLVCVLSLLPKDNVDRGGLLAAGALLAIFTYRSIRTANQYFDKTASPILAALAGERQHIARVRFEPARRGSLSLFGLGGQPAQVVVSDRAGHRLPLRLPADGPEHAAEALLDAFAELTPSAVIEAGPRAA